MAKRNAALNKIASILRKACAEEFPAALVSLSQKETQKNINKACRKVATEILTEVLLMIECVWFCIVKVGDESKRTIWASKEECYAHAAKQLREWIKLDLECLGATHGNLVDDANTEGLEAVKRVASLVEDNKIAEAIDAWNDLPELIENEEKAELYVYENPLYRC